MICGPGHRLHMRTEGPSCWGAVSLPADEFTAPFNRLTGQVLAMPTRAQRHRRFAADPIAACVRELLMPSSAIRAFTDPDDYAAAIRQGMSEMTVTGRGAFRAEIVRIDFHHLWMQRFAESTSRIRHVAGLGGRAVIAFPAQPGPAQSWQGVELAPANLIRHREGASYYHRSAGPSVTAALSLPLAEIAAIGTVFAGCDLSPPRESSIVTPPPSAMARLQRLHATAGQIAKTHPEVIAHPDSARGLEQALIEAMVACLATGDASEEHGARGRHALIMRRFHRVVAEHPDQPLYIPEICKAIGVAERTLRVCCQEQLGTSPKRFLLMRRMQFARRDLSRGSPETTSVTEVATRYGFWNFGLFAGAYKSAFGELPSVALARQAG
jgi:AraC-like DNA-binding protein